MKKIDLIKACLSDGKAHKLKNIVKYVAAGGIKGTPSSEYISIYHLLRDHPELFSKAKFGEYVLNDTSKQWVRLDPICIIDEIDEILRDKSYQTPAQVWRKLLKRGIQITYNMTQHYLGDHFSSDRYARYFVEK